MREDLLSYKFFLLSSVGFYVFFPSVSSLIGSKDPVVSESVFS